MDELLKYYFQKGFSYKNMLLFLSKYHDTEMSMRSLQQRLHDMGLKRRNISYKIQEILQEIVKVPWQVVRLFCGASEQEVGAQVTCRLADGNLERIRRLFANL